MINADKPKPSEVLVYVEVDGTARECSAYPSAGRRDAHLVCYLEALSTFVRYPMAILVSSLWLDQPGSPQHL